MASSSPLPESSVLLPLVESAVVEELALSYIALLNACEASSSSLTAVLMASANARLLEPSVFYLWQLLRVFLIYLVIVRTVKSLDDIHLLMFGLSLGLCLQLTLVLYQRFGLGDISASGSFGHRNQLGLVSNLVMMPLVTVFAQLLCVNEHDMELKAGHCCCCNAGTGSS